jgi:hypothetical protein
MIIINIQTRYGPANGSSFAFRPLRSGANPVEISLRGLNGVDLTTVGCHVTPPLRHET